MPLRSVIAGACVSLALVTGGLRSPVPAAAQMPTSYAESSNGHRALAVTTRGTLRVRVAPPRRPFGQVEVLDDGNVFEGVVAIGRNGATLVAWTRRGEDRRLHAAYRPPGAVFDAPMVLDEDYGGGSDAPALGVDGSGDALVIWTSSDDGRLGARVRDAVAGWGPMSLLGPGAAFRPKIAVPDEGPAVAAWDTDSDPDTSAVHVATRTDGGFGPAETLAAGRGGPSEPVVAANDRGDAVVAWVERDGDRFTVDGAFRSRARPFGRPVRLSRKDGVFPSVAIASTGRAVIAWADNRRRLAEARVRASTGRLGSPATLSADLEENTGPTAVATGCGAVVWADRDPGASRIRIAGAGPGREFRRPRLVTRTKRYIDELDVLVDPQGASLILGPTGRPRVPLPIDPGRCQP